MRSNKVFAALVVLFTSVFFLLYWRALSFPFEFDDFPLIVQNRGLRYLFHPRIFLENENLRTRPIATLSFALSYAWAGMSLSALRIPSFFLHWANGFFVGYFFWFFRKNLFGAVIAGALFLLHPLAVDSVIYLSARAGLLALFFLFSALYFFSWPRPNVFTWIFFLFSALAACLSRESGLAIVPLVLLFHRRLGRRHSELIPYLGPLAIVALLMAVKKASYLDSALRGFFQIAGDVEIHSFAEYLRLSLSVWPMNIALFFRPDWQSIDHQIFLPASWLSLPVMAGGMIWLGFAAALYFFWRSRADGFFFLLWAAASLIVTNSVFPVLDPLAERNLYPALPALAWLFAMVCEHDGRRVAFAVFSLLVMAGGSTSGRIEDWRTPRALWENAYRKYPGKFRIVFNTWWSQVSEDPNSELAPRTLLGFLRTRLPGSLTYEEQEVALTSLGNSLKRISQATGKTAREEGARLFGEPDFWSSLAVLKATMQEKDWERHWNSALELSLKQPVSERVREPNYVQQIFDIQRADFYRANGRGSEALKILEKIILSYPERHFPFWIKREALGDLYVAAGREEEALNQYEAASYQHKVFKQFPPELYEKLYVIYLKRGDFLRASDAIGELLRVHSDDSALRLQYATMLEKIHSRNAAQQFSEADFYAHKQIALTDDREIVRP